MGLNQAPSDLGSGLIWMTGERSISTHEYLLNPGIDNLVVVVLKIKL